MKYLPKIALGAWAWGNDGTFGSSFTSDQLRPIFEAAMKNGLNLWDTAFAYGMGTSEKMLAGFIKGLPRESYLISDKFTPQCADSSSPTAMQDMIEMQLGMMELDRFDVYWIHNVWDAPKWTEELAKYFEGKDSVPIIGVSNHNLAEIKQANDILKAHGLKLGAVQNHYSLINRSSEDSGMLFPEKKLLLSENCIEYSKYSKEEAALARETIVHEIIGDMENGTNAFFDWNLALDEKGGPNYVGNYCHAPLIFDTAAKQLSVQSSYTALWHFSHFITPGSRRILTSSFSSEVEKTAFLRSDDTFVLVLQNRGKAKTICVELGGEIAELELPEKALATILIEAASPIA